MTAWNNGRFLAAVLVATMALGCGTDRDSPDPRRPRPSFDPLSPNGCAPVPASARMRDMTATAAGTSVAPLRPRLPWVLLSITVVLVLCMLVLSVGQEEEFDTVFFGALALALGTTGAFVASQHPSNPIGWILAGQGVWGGIVETWEAFSYHSLPTADAGTWVIGWSWIVDLALYAVVFLLFPTGHLLTRRWRWVLWVVVAACVVAIPGQALNPENAENPLTIDSPVLETAFITGMMLLLVAIVGAIASLVVRYRRAVGIERLQLRQLVFAAAAFVPIMVVAVPFYYDSVLVQAAVGIGLLALPVAAGLAILRYRLYDIDVVINRTLVYGSLTATLAGVYVGSVLLLQLALSGLTEGSGSRSPRPPWRSRPCSGPPGLASRRWSTVASSAAATTRRERSRPSAPGCATRSTSAR